MHRHETRPSVKPGGLDIIAIIISRTSHAIIVLLLTAMNGIIVFISGAVFNWGIALYTLLSIYLTGQRNTTNQKNRPQS